jgi:hypothetical protein
LLLLCLLRIVILAHNTLYGLPVSVRAQETLLLTINFVPCTLVQECVRISLNRKAQNLRVGSCFFQAGGERSAAVTFCLPQSHPGLVENCGSNKARLRSGRNCRHHGWARHAFSIQQVLLFGLSDAVEPLLIPSDSFFSFIMSVLSLLGKVERFWISKQQVRVFYIVWYAPMEWLLGD